VAIHPTPDQEHALVREFFGAETSGYFVEVGANHSNLQTHRYLKKRGYRLIRRLGHNGWYVPAGEAVTVSSSERWEILRKYYLALPFRVVRNGWRRTRRLYVDWWLGR
jgi:hypothetical protein